MLHIYHDKQNRNIAQTETKKSCNQTTSICCRFASDLLLHCYIVYPQPTIVHIKTPIKTTMISNACYITTYISSTLPSRENCKRIILLTIHPVRNQLNFCQ